MLISGEEKTKPDTGQPFARTPVNSREKIMSDTADRVKKIVVEHLGVDEDKVTENASFIDDLGRTASIRSSS